MSGVTVAGFVYAVCRRWPRHWWRQLEPRVRCCRLCRTFEFASGATQEQFEFWLLGYVLGNNDDCPQSSPKDSSGGAGGHE